MLRQTLLLYIIIIVNAHNCLPPCQECSNQGCTSCINSYFLKNHTCYSCSIDCLTCNQKQCSQCHSGYYLSQGQCLSCSNGCLTCSGQNSCSLCGNSYFLVQGSCRTCPMICSHCNQTQCFSCIVGYYPKHGQCISCGQHCLFCLADVGCLSCTQNYFKEGNSCQACSENCSKCSKSTECQVCQKGFYLSNNVCQTCDDCHDKIGCFQRQKCSTKIGFSAVQNQQSFKTVGSTDRWIMYCLMTCSTVLFVLFYYFCLIPFYKRYIKIDKKISNSFKSKQSQTIQQDIIYIVFHTAPVQQTKPTTSDTNVRLQLQNLDNNLIPEGYQCAKQVKQTT